MKDKKSVKDIAKERVEYSKINWDTIKEELEEWIVRSVNNRDLPRPK